MAAHLRRPELGAGEHHQVASAAAGTADPTQDALLPSAHQVSAMAGFLLAFLGYGSLGLATALAVRGTGASFAVWFLYVALGERMLGAGLDALGADAVVRFLPIGVFDSLGSYVQHDPAALGRAVSHAGSQGRAPPQVWEWELLLPAALGWIAFFVAAAFVIHRRRDL